MRPITIVDFSSAWIMKDVFQIARRTPGTMSREEVLSFYHKVQADGVELMHDYWQDCSPQYLQELAERYELPITCYVFFLDLAVGGATLRQRIDEGMQLLDRTAAIGTSRAMVVPAVFKSEVAEADQKSGMIHGLRILAEHAHDLGITMLAENIDYAPVRPLMGRGTQCRELCAAVDSPSFRLIYDSGCSLAVHEDPIETLHTMAPYIAHVHLKNLRVAGPDEHPERFTTANSGQLLVATPLDSGLVDIRRVVAELDSIGYAGPLLLEYQGENPLEALPSDVAFLHSLERGLVAADGYSASGAEVDQRRSVRHWHQKE